MIERYLQDDTRRLLELSETAYIKRVYTESAIVFECCIDNSVYTTEDKNQVKNWIDTKGLNNGKK